MAPFKPFKFQKGECRGADVQRLSDGSISLTQGEVQRDVTTPYFKHDPKRILSQLSLRMNESLMPAVANAALKQAVSDERERWFNALAAAAVVKPW